MDGHIAVDLHVHALHLRRGNAGALHAAAGASALAEEAAPIAVIAHREGPASLFLSGRRLALLRFPGFPDRLLTAVFIAAVKLDVNLSLEAIGILFFDLIRHITDNDRRLVHGILGLTDRLPDDTLHAMKQLAGEVPAAAFLPGQLSLGTQTVQIGQQLVYVAQVLQRLVKGLVLVKSLGRQILPAAVEVLAEFLDQVHLSGGIGGGGQPACHRNDKSCPHVVHRVSPPPKKSERPEAPWCFATPGCFLPTGAFPHR